MSNHAENPEKAWSFSSVIVFALGILTLIAFVVFVVVPGVLIEAVVVFFRFIIQSYASLIMLGRRHLMLHKDK